MSITSRLEKLERAARAAGPQSYIIHWHIDPDCHAVECEGVRYERRQGESLDELIDRAAVDSPGPMVWVDAVE